VTVCGLCYVGDGMQVTAWLTVCVWHYVGGGVTVTMCGLRYAGNTTWQTLCRWRYVGDGALAYILELKLNSEVSKWITHTCLCYTT